eukprot:GEMP01087410.1.p2 GENE.GEMP01087410.1~~GEMP01087410.1.p2  ORF type:complete len:121 (-),score=13.10 GEMP01087410.1:131-493(-)
MALQRLCTSSAVFPVSSDRSFTFAERKRGQCWSSNPMYLRHMRGQDSLIHSMLPSSMDLSHSAHFFVFFHRTRGPAVAEKHRACPGVGRCRGSTTVLPVAVIDCVVHAREGSARAANSCR